MDIPTGHPDLGKITAQFGQVAYLNCNDVHGRSLLAVAGLKELVIDQLSSEDPLEALRTFRAEVNDWTFGYFSYDLKNSLGPLSNHHQTAKGCPQLRFFQPEIVVEWKADRCQVHYYSEVTSPERLNAFVALFSGHSESRNIRKVEFEQGVAKGEYLQTVRNIQREIQLGNIYELNYCIPFEARVDNPDTAELYKRLNERTQAPFSVYYSDADHALMCGSPERYLQLRGRHLKAQPIKGTIRRGMGGEDENLIEQLRNDPKERAENVMITDLVRNDLSRVAAPKSVVVEELCETYTFRTVHQMISTIVADLADDKDGIDALRATFPMGSMTGAPKVSAMRLIDQFENQPRGIYSGAFGYFEPNGDFDFNVIIRSMVYDRKAELLSFHVGSAITSLSDPEKEYEECLLKAEALLKSTKAGDYVA